MLPSKKMTRSVVPPPKSTIATPKSRSSWLNVHVITGAVTSAQNIVKSVNRAGLDVAVDDRAAKGSRPIMFDLKLGLRHLDRAVVQRLRNLALLGREIFHLPVLERPDRDHGQARVDLN